MAIIIVAENLISHRKWNKHDTVFWKILIPFFLRFCYLRVWAERCFLHRLLSCLPAMGRGSPSQEAHGLFSSLLGVEWFTCHRSPRTPTHPWEFIRLTVHHFPPVGFAMRVSPTGPFIPLNLLSPVGSTVLMAMGHLEEAALLEEACH